MEILRRIVLLVLMIVVTTGAMAQNSKEERNAAKKAKNEEQMRVSMENSAKLKTYVMAKRFVLEANTLYARSGASHPLNSNINFVGFDGENSSIQLSFNQIVGWNGVGGVTLDGKIQKMEISGKEDEPNFIITATVLK